MCPKALKVEWLIREAFQKSSINMLAGYDPEWDIAVLRIFKHCKVMRSSSKFQKHLHPGVEINMTNKAIRIG